MEVWKDIDGYNGKYQVSNLGNVRSFSRWKNGGLLKPGINTNGYYSVNLVKDGRKNTQLINIHRLVAMTFLDNPKGLREVNHKDGNKLNNAVDNLEWVDRFENIRHAVRTGLIPYKSGADNCNARAVVQKTKDGKVVREWGCIADIHRELGFATNGIVCCCRKKPKYHTAYGYIWEYKQ